jgi:hypothetical protein
LPWHATTLASTWALEIVSVGLLAFSPRIEDGATLGRMLKNSPKHDMAKMF